MQIYVTSFILIVPDYPGLASLAPVCNARGVKIKRVFVDLKLL